MLFQVLVDLHEINQRPAETVQLVDDDGVDLPGFNISQELLQGRAVGIAAGEAAARQALPQILDRLATYSHLQLAV